MALIKKAKLEAIYGIAETLPQEQVVLEDLSMDVSLPEAAARHDLSVEEEQEFETRVQLMLADKDAEIAQAKAASLAQISQEIEAAKLEAHEIIVEASQQADLMRRELDVEREEFEELKAEQESILEQEKLRIENEAMIKADDYINQLMQILSGFNKFKAEILSEAKDEIAGLALAIAKQVLGEQAKIDQSLILEQVKAAIAKLAVSSGLVEIAIHPFDLVYKAQLESGLAKILDANVRINFVEDSAVNQGSCVVTTSGGRLDASFGSQLELIKVAFERYLGHKISEIPDLPGIGEERMASGAKKSKSKKATDFIEPSDADLELIDELDLEDFEIDEDMDKLLQDVLNSDADVNDDASVKIDDDLSLDKADEELSFDENLLDEDDEKQDEDDDVEFEEYNEFSDDPDLAEDSNFDGSSLDDRFPEY